MKTHCALLRLAHNRNDIDAVIDIFEENKCAIREAIRHWVGRRQTRNWAECYVMLYIASVCQRYDPLQHDPTEWIAVAATEACNSMRLEIKTRKREQAK